MEQPFSFGEKSNPVWVKVALSYSQRGGRIGWGKDRSGKQKFTFLPKYGDKVKINV